MRTAAVAAVLRPGRREPEVLFVRRPQRAGDRWGGHVAFPGGLASAGDGDPVQTARREALEEVALDLDEPIGALSELVTAQPGRARPLRVAPFVFVVSASAQIEPDPREVEEAEWIPISTLVTVRPRTILRRIGRIRAPVRAMPLSIGTLWGLTYSMVRELVRIASATAK
jgi:8-oxo-dGTP pyrophosphatase MutT (NUDIX family)